MDFGKLTACCQAHRHLKALSQTAQSDVRLPADAGLVVEMVPRPHRLLSGVGPWLPEVVPISRVCPAHTGRTNDKRKAL